MKILNGLLSCDPAAGTVWWNVRTSNRAKVGVPIRQPKDHKNYPQVRHADRVYLLHRLIWEAVHGPIPKGKEINHINGIRNDNRLENLELVTHQENVAHAKRTGLTPRCTRPERALIGYHKVTGDGLYFKSSRVAKDHGFHNTTMVAQGHRKSDKNYIWEYA